MLAWPEAVVRARWLARARLPPALKPRRRQPADRLRRRRPEWRARPPAMLRVAAMQFLRRGRRAPAEHRRARRVPRRLEPVPGGRWIGLTCTARRTRHR